jgi:hypothetical protein
MVKPKRRGISDGETLKCFVYKPGIAYKPGQYIGKFKRLGTLITRQALHISQAKMPRGGDTT